jgi:hypothetical protein
LSGDVENNKGKFRRGGRLICGRHGDEILVGEMML